MLMTVDKKILRRQAIELRSSMAASDAIKCKSDRIIAKILKSDDFKMAQNIALYLPIKNEIDISALLKMQNKNFYLPRCNKNELEFCLYKGDDFVKTGSYGIMEPINESINPVILDLIYIPALMANNKNYRLGYGKGFYDRFFAKNNINAKKVIIVAKEFYNNAFCEDEFDMPADYVLCD